MKRLSDNTKGQRAFINDDFMLTTKTARELYHRHAEKMPIIDYHCHLPPREIAEDRRWDNIAEVWLGGDHYKWRQMRSNGIDERLVTGDAPWHDKFVAYAQTMERLVRNPLFDWSQLELARYFGVTEILNGASAERVWKACNANRHPFMRQFEHYWGGFTAYDLIMPLFIFMCGAAIPLALPKRLDAEGRPTAAFWKPTFDGDVGLTADEETARNYEITH